MKVFLLIALFLFPPCLSAQSGESGSGAFWRQALGGTVIGQPAIQGRSVVVALDSGVVKAYSASGTLQWSYAAPGRVSPFVSRSPDGVSYFSRTNGIFLAIGGSGQELWRRNPGGPLSAPVLTGWDGRVFVPTEKKITCYTASGNLLWSRTFDERIGLGPRLDQQGGIIFALENGEVVRLDPFGGALRWRLRALPRVLLCFGRIMALHADGGVELFDPADPDKPPQSLPGLSGQPLAAVSRGTQAAITLSSGQVVLMDADDGKILWIGDSHISMQGGRADEAAMLYDERGVYVLSKSGATGFGPDGRRLWFTTLSNAGGIPAFSDDGVLYSGGVDWIFYAWRLEDRSRVHREEDVSYGLAAPPSPLSWADNTFRYDDSEIRKQFDTIRRGIESGAVGENERAWTSYLMEIVSAGYNRPGVSIALPPVHIPERAQALRLLARFASVEAVPWLASVFRKESDPALKAAAAAAIGSIGMDPGGTALRAFHEAIYSPELARDEQLMLAITAAAGMLCRFSGPAQSETGIRILVHLSGWAQPSSVRRQARQELDALRN